MKTAARQILTFSICIGMLASTQLLAQQTNPNKQSSQNTAFQDNLRGPTARVRRLNPAPVQPLPNHPRIPPRHQRPHRKRNQAIPCQALYPPA